MIEQNIQLRAKSAPEICRRHPHRDKMKKLLIASIVVVMILAAYVLFYIYAYRAWDNEALGAQPVVVVAGAERERSLSAHILGPIARLHQEQLESRSFEQLVGTWKLVDPTAFESTVPATLEFFRRSGSTVSVKPALPSRGQMVEDLAISQRIKSPYPTWLFTGSTVNIFLFSDDRIGIQTSEMDVFGLGAEYERQPPRGDPEDGM